MGELAKKTGSGSEKRAFGLFSPSNNQQSFSVSGLPFTPKHVIIQAVSIPSNGLFMACDWLSYEIHREEGSWQSNWTRTYTADDHGFTIGSSLVENGAPWFYAGVTYRWVAWKE